MVEDALDDVAVNIWMASPTDGALMSSSGSSSVAAPQGLTPLAARAASTSLFHCCEPVYPYTLVVVVPSSQAVRQGMWWLNLSTRDVSSWDDLSGSGTRRLKLR
jgi:hypothetical protein